ncbi:hypothetical protein JI435_430070 [Parastagonospora nodorum SN15]|uniref:Uncharacterized protein n=1 Tax=Phaeosphaeria nodorum (strain SN15 / ATCC MYA-4574 / FGSC 10173) TaxID=321614 RepID=A0A7U2EVR5_PHANO|nr:hypothetical protein JI435_430070 [Parastagonospora nodorum SN15]
MPKLTLSHLSLTLTLADFRPVIWRFDIRSASVGACEGVDDSNCREESNEDSSDCKTPC